MRILVTGVSGQVGGALTRQIENHIVIPATRSALDLSEPRKIKSILSELRPDVIINCAAYTAVDQAEQERDRACVINAVAPGVLAEWARLHRRALIQLSTDYVFDGSGHRPWKESDHADPRCWYGVTKHLGEQAALAAGDDVLVIRTSWVYDSTGKNFLRTIAKLGAEREELRIVNDQIGAPTSAFVIADGISRIIRGNRDLVRQQFKKCGHILHLTTAGETSWHGFAVAIIRGLQARHVPLTVKAVVPILTKDYPTPASRPHNSRLSTARLRTVFGIDPLHWEDALAKELDSLTATRRA